MRSMALLLSAVLTLALASVPVHAQSGIQWGGNAKVAVDRATEMGVPVMFWVTEGSDLGEDNDLKDAQRDSFRDPVVQAITERYYVPCRVSRNSRMLAEAERLGLPTNFGLYIAIITPTGKVLDQIDPGQVATPEALAGRLADASRAYRDSVYNETLKATLTNPESTKPTVRQALNTVWQMRIYSADHDIVKLLSRADVKPEERSRLYQLLAAFGTEACTNALLDAAPTEKPAATALARAEPAALPTLLAALPPDTGEASPRQIAAYRAAAAIARVQNTRPDKFWTESKLPERVKELERVRAAAQAVFDSWDEREGHWR